MSWRPQPNARLKRSPAVSTSFSESTPFDTVFEQAKVMTALRKFIVCCAPAGLA